MSRDSFRGVLIGFEDGEEVGAGEPRETPPDPPPLEGPLNGLGEVRGGSALPEMEAEEGDLEEAAGVNNAAVCPAKLWNIL